ncbi:MAG TPA: glycosyltransferase [Pyrinomonadaceae bacterium]|nr:glycosyltransferase [Pyrinomonadaceae bacterium]
MRPNVLHIVDSFQQGGTERQAVQLARLLAEGGRYRPLVACLNAEGPLRAEVERLNLGEIPEYRLTSFYDRNFAAQLRSFARFLRRSEVDIVHAHDFYTNVFGMAGAALAGVRARVASKRETEGFRSRAQKFVERRAFQLARRVVVNADAVGEMLKGEGVPASKLVTVYNGLDAARVRPPLGFRRETALAALGLPAEPARRFVTIVANLRHAVKDHPTFLRAAARVRAEVSDAAFVLAGEGELEQELREYAAGLGIAPDVFFTGRCARVAELLAVSDVCVLSSRAEGFSNAILEYMAAGRAVVATDVGGAREAIVEGETGHLVAAGDDAALAARVAALLKDPPRARAMGERGRALVARKFSCEAQLARTEELYDRLLARDEAKASRGVGRVSNESA